MVKKSGKKNKRTGDWLHKMALIYCRPRLAINFDTWQRLMTEIFTLQSCFLLATKIKVDNLIKIGLVPLRVTTSFTIGKIKSWPSLNFLRKQTTKHFLELHQNITHRYHSSSPYGWWPLFIMQFSTFVRA